MVIPSQEGKHPIMWMDQGLPSNIGYLPSGITKEELPEVLNLIETIHDLGAKRGQKTGKKEVYDYIQRQCKQLEDSDI